MLLEANTSTLRQTLDKGGRSQLSFDSVPELVWMMVLGVRAMHLSRIKYTGNTTLLSNGDRWEVHCTPSAVSVVCYRSDIAKNRAKDRVQNLEMELAEQQYKEGSLTIQLENLSLRDDPQALDRKKVIADELIGQRQAIEGTLSQLSVAREEMRPCFDSLTVPHTKALSVRIK